MKDVTMPALPRNCTFTPTDWQALAPFWYPVAFSREVTTKPFGARLLDERIVLYRTSGGTVSAARDLCLHRGVPLSMGFIEGDDLVCAYHGLRYDGEGRCVCIPAHPGVAIPPKLRLQSYPVEEHYGLVWVRLVDDGPRPLPNFEKWNDLDYLQVLPNSVELNASAGRQIEGFLDVSHFAFVHVETFGERQNPEVPNYPVHSTATGFQADYISTVSNYPTHLKHLNPPGFQWRRLFEVFLPFTAKLTVFFPNDGQLHILNATLPGIGPSGARLCCRSAGTSTGTRRCKPRSILIIRSSRRTSRLLNNNIRKISRLTCTTKCISARIAAP